MPSWKKVVVSGSEAAIPSVSTAADFTIDAGGDIIFDADGTDIILKDGGTEFGSFKRVSSDFVIKSSTQDKDIVFKGDDGGATVTALTLDMSDGGKAKFSGGVSGSFEGNGSSLTDLPITIKDEGSNLTTSVSSIDFVGSGVTATTSGNNVTATIVGADLDSIFETDGNGDLMPTTSTEGLSVFYDYDSNDDIQPRA